GEQTDRLLQVQGAQGAEPPPDLNAQRWGRAGGRDGDEEPAPLRRARLAHAFAPVALRCNIRNITIAAVMAAHVTAATSLIHRGVIAAQRRKAIWAREGSAAKHA